LASIPSNTYTEVSPCLDGFNFTVLVKGISSVFTTLSEDRLSKVTTNFPESSYDAFTEGIGDDPFDVTFQTNLSTPSSYPCVNDVMDAFSSDPTDVNSQYPSELWLSTVKAIDVGSLYGLGETSSGVELNSLLAFDVTNSIHYGSLEAGQHNENLDRETTITSRGNVGLTQELSGSSLCADYPTCSPNLQIFVNNQRYSANSSTPYTSGNTLTFDPTITNIYMPKPTSSTPVTANIWWGLGVPIGTVSGAYNGELVVTGIKSSPDKW